MKLKHLLFASLILVLVSLLILPAGAESPQMTSGLFTYSVTDGKAQIESCSPTAKGTVTVPSKIDGYPVTSISSYAFENHFNVRENVTGVIISEGITSIGNTAFFKSNIKSITIPSTVKTIPEEAFLSCKQLSEVKLSEGLTTIGDRAFEGCEALTNIKLPDSLTYIGNRAFMSCRALKSIRIPDQVTHIGQYAFTYCNVLESITMGSSITEIGEQAFYNCYKLKKVTIPGGVTSIPRETFQNCRALTTVSIPNSVKSVGYGAFCDTGLTTIYYGGTSAQWQKITIDSLNGKLSKQELIKYVTPAKITTQPKNAAAISGNKVTVKVAATGSGLSYTWYINDGKGFKKASTTTATYSTTMNSKCDGRRIYCVVRDKYGFTVESNVATLSMKPATKLVITKQPKNVTVIKNKTAKISVSADGDGLTYQWYYKTKSGKSFKKLSSARRSTYSIKMTSSKNGRQMYCVVKDQHGDTVKTVTVTLKVAPKVKITKQPKSTVKAVAGKKVSVSVKASGDNLKYQWYYKDKGSSSYKKVASGTTATYSATMNAATSGRKVYCVVTDKYGQTVKTKTTTFYAKTSIVKQPTSAKAVSGEKATVRISAAGEKLTYKWYYKDPGAKKFKKSSTTKSTYSCTMNNATDGRQVYCVVKSKYGGSVKSSIVTLKVAPKVKITKQPTTTAKAIIGENISVTVKATGDGLKYQWYYKDKGSASFKKYATGTAATYSTTMDVDVIGRQIYCVVTDKYGQTVTSKVTTFYAKISITQQPSSVVVASGENATVSVSALGEDLTYQWYKKDSGDSDFSLDSTMTGASYSLEMSEALDGRQVYCLITDKFGDTATTDTVTLSLPEAGNY